MNRIFFFERDAKRKAGVKWPKEHQSRGPTVAGLACFFLKRKKEKKILTIPSHTHIREISSISCKGNLFISSHKNVWLPP